MGFHLFEELDGLARSDSLAEIFFFVVLLGAGGFDELECGDAAIFYAFLGQALCFFKACDVGLELSGSFDAERVEESMQGISNDTLDELKPEAAE